MANKTATLTLNMSYIGPGGGTVTEAAKSALASYQSQISGTLDVPDGAATGATYAIPFGTITTDCTAIVIQNNLSQAVSFRANGLLSTATGQTIGPTGVYLNTYSGKIGRAHV
jgi:hypothetical protein